MIIRTLALTGLLAVGAGTAIYMTPAQARTFVSVQIAPPPLRHENVLIRPGYVWAPGYWRWNGRQYVWIGGRYIVVRAGQAWVHPYWEQRGPRWFYHEGYWRHERHERREDRRHDRRHDHR
jgi:hypothetical protein